MCGIIGLRCRDRELSEYIVKNLLLYSQIRGKHATGIAYFKGRKIEKIVDSVPASKFIEKLKFPDSDYVIGHVRYSTSNLHYNQPLIGNNIGIVHNGIMTQEEPEEWTQYDGPYENFVTKNDSELLLKCLENKRQPFIDFPNCSAAVGMLEEGKMYCFRNHTRPLWIFESEISDEDGVPLFSGFCSTEDIMERTFKELELDVISRKAEAFTKYLFQGNGVISISTMKSKPTLFNEDQQKPTEIERKYV